MVKQGKITTVKPPKPSNHNMGFSKVGGLENHLKILHDLIIIPLLHNNVYTHFNIKIPKGVLFYGPPGTGKTLVAGAVASEINRISPTKVTFYQCRSTDVLDKWVGESEKKLQQLFDKAIENRPSLIFFDEIDGLAPIRNYKNDQFQCTLITTFLNLMDGLDSVPGVIIIGATNRIDAVDPALRRPGRFDRELYFPLPSTLARKEILQVHTQSWKEKPSSELLTYLANVTTGFCGADLQALCTETVLCGLKRLHPHLRNCKLKSTKIDANSIKLEEDDFLNAREHLIPSSQKYGVRMRKLNTIIRPLLENQINTILKRIQLLWPHFFIQFYKYLIDNDYYIGKVILIGTSIQGLYSHIIPAILHNFEHLPANFVELNYLNKNISELHNNKPSILILSKIDHLWSCFDYNQQIALTTTLESLHPSTPILIIATCETAVPNMLQNFFCNSSSLIVQIKNPTENEIEDFFAPLFFDDSSTSLEAIWKTHQPASEPKIRTLRNRSINVYNMKPDSGRILKHHRKIHRKFYDYQSSVEITIDPNDDGGFGDKFTKLNFSLILTKLIQRGLRLFSRKETLNEKKRVGQQFKSNKDPQRAKILELWQKAMIVTKNLTVSQLEVLHDSIVACISIYKDNFEDLMNNIEKILNDVENCRKD